MLIELFIALLLSAGEHGERLSAYDFDENDRGQAGAIGIVPGMPGMLQLVRRKLAISRRSVKCSARMWSSFGMHPVR